MTAEAGSPSLNRHVPRTEERARIDAALKVAKETMIFVNRLDTNDDSAPNIAMTRMGEALLAIHRILDPAQKETR